MNASRKALIGLTIMLIGDLVIDQVTKEHAHRDRMVWEDPRNVETYQGSRYELFVFGEPENSNFYLSGGINYVRNQGAAWGALSDVKESFRVPFFYGVTILAVFMILQFFRTTPPEHHLARFSLALILAGAVGNFIDRVQRGYVIDFLSVKWNLLGWRYHFPNFNIADSSITIGVTLLLIDMIVLEGQRRKRASAAGGEGTSNAAAIS